MAPRHDDGKIIDELDKTVRLPGLANLWVMPIRNRIDMLSTGVKSPIGIKVSGQSLADIDGAAEQIEEAAKTVPGVVSAIAERLTGGRYVEVSVDRLKAARWGSPLPACRATSSPPWAERWRATSSTGSRVIRSRFAFRRAGVIRLKRSAICRLFPGPARV